MSESLRADEPLDHRGRVTETHSMSEPQRQLAAAFKSVQVAFRRMRGRQTHRQDGLSYAQYGLLFTLEKGCAQSARELGTAAELSPASVAQMLEGLEASGLVARTRSEQDKRVVMTELTEQGHAAVATMRAQMEPKWRAALAGFTDDELSNAASVLTRLADYFTLLAEGNAPAPAPAPAVAVASATAGT
jgi:DNA-binding MarR family transcriptional regulator